MALQDRGIEYAFLDADMIAGGALSLVDGFIMPGGADLYYCEKLNGRCNAEIKAFIKNGGGYLGICAGAYYACSALDWNNGEIAGTRELALIDAKAVGPVFEFIEDGDIAKSWNAAVPITANSRKFYTLYNGGPLFTNIKDDVTVYASYAQSPAVIGKGNVVLSSPHIEICGDAFSRAWYKHNNKSADHEAAVADMLLQDADAQNAFFDSILRIIGTHNSNG